MLWCLDNRPQYGGLFNLKRTYVFPWNTRRVLRASPTGMFLKTGKLLAFLRHAGAVMELSIGDLLERWVYTRRGIYNLRQLPEFPNPYRILPGRAGKHSPRWLEADIAAYETAYPELLSRSLKVRKVVGYFRACQKG